MNILRVLSKVSSIEKYRADGGIIMGQLGEKWQPYDASTLYKQVVVRGFEEADLPLCGLIRETSILSEEEKCWACSEVIKKADTHVVYGGQIFKSKAGVYTNQVCFEWGATDYRFWEKVYYALQNCRVKKSKLDGGVRVESVKSEFDNHVQDFDWMMIDLAFYVAGFEVVDQCDILIVADLRAKINDHIHKNFDQKQTKHLLWRNIQAIRKPFYMAQDKYRELFDLLQRVVKCENQ